MIDKFILHVYFRIIIIILHLFGFRKLEQTHEVEDMPCNCTIVESQKMANCTGQGKELLKVPWGCGNDIKTMDLSGVTIGYLPEFTKTSFENYTNLVNLYMKETKLVKFCDDAHDPARLDCPSILKSDFFTPLTSLEVLDMSGIFVNFEKSIKWPPKLKILHMVKTNIKEVSSMADLKHLIEFNGANNKIRQFPQFDTSNSVIKHIDLIDNPLDELNVSQIASLCELNYLGVRVNADGALKDWPKFCSCIRLKKWMKNKGISGNEYQACDNYKGALSEKSCDMSFSAELQLYDECAGNSTEASLTDLLIFATFFFFLFPVLYFANEIFANYTSKADESTSRKAAKRRISYHSSTFDDYETEIDFETESMQS